jgi:periplasmic divalent cation tolerance protein
MKTGPFQVKYTRTEAAGSPMTISVMTTIDKRETLEGIGRVLLEKRLVACIQIVGPIKSMYWWNGRIEEAEEWIGIMKTRSELFEELERTLKALHTYEVPEIITMEAKSVFPAYEKWIAAETGG